MGYTHYMYLNRAGPQGQWSEAFMAASQIIKASPVPLGDGFGEGDSPLYSDDGIWANGVGEDGHETLEVPATLAQLERQPYLSGDRTFGDQSHFMFCKTAHKPYDVVVTAVYATLRAIAGPECVDVTSDGEPEEWQEGCKLASEVLGRDVPIPITES